MKSTTSTQAKTFWLTGFSGAGKTTISNEVHNWLHPTLPLYLLDGDCLRETVCAGLGFSKEDRHENLRRAAGVSRIINDAGVHVLAAFVSPYQTDRDMVRAIVGPERFYEIHIATSISECESRDPKGLYKKARSGRLPHFTGIDDPYEVPVSPHHTIQTHGCSVRDSAVNLCRFITREIFSY